MRLVDSDALPIVARGKNGHRKYVFADITDAPTIDAIPVEWLREQCKVFDSMSRGGHHSAWIIKALILQWQNEKEAQDG